MPRMDPDFAEAFSSEYPEAYSEAVRNMHRNRSKADAAINVHVAVVPEFALRFSAGLLVMLFLIATFFIAFEESERRGAGIPSGQLMNSQAGTGFSVLKDFDKTLTTVSNPDSDLGQKIAPIGKAGTDILRTMMKY